jgi:hypothetical protein
LGGWWFKASPGQKRKALSEKYLKAKKGWGMAQMVEHLPSKHEALKERERKKGRREGGREGKENTIKLKAASLKRLSKSMSL